MGSPTRRGFSLVDLVVAVVILVLLAGMVIPARFAVREGTHHPNCGSNQRQIVIAMIVYQYDLGGRWPVFPVDSRGVHTKVSGGTLDPIGTTLATFEFLAHTMGRDLPLQVFRCPSHPTESLPNAPVKLGEAEWKSSWANDGPRPFGYSFDWSVPGEDRLGIKPDFSRVVTADRDQSAHNGKFVAVVFSDSHVGTLKNQSCQFLNPDAANDDIYSDVGDGSMNLPGQGSSTRAFVR